MANFTARKIYKQMYPATYNFKDEAVGTSGADIGFVDTAVLYDGACEIVSEWQGHKKVLRLQDDATFGEDPYIRHNITQATAGTREFYIGTNDVTEYWELALYEADNGYIIRLRIIGSFLDYRDSDNLWQEIQTVTNNILYHIKITWRADNTFDVWVDGLLKVDNQSTNRDQVSGPTFFQLRCYGDSNDYVYLDAWGDPDNDSNYNVGDNIHWRHYKESTDSFEGDDVGVQGTSITWVDAVDTAASCVLVAEFGAHKKILRQAYTSATGGFDYSQHNFNSQDMDGWCEFWIKTNDATARQPFILQEGSTSIVALRYNGDVFQYLDDGDVWQTITGITPLDNTWYHFYMKWVNGANDTFDVWIDNIQYESGTQCNNNQTSGINRFVLYQFDASDYLYLDAPMSSLDGDVRADNRTLDYKAQSYDDITSIIAKVEVSDEAYMISTAVIEISKDVVTLSGLHILQLYDKNNDLRFEGNFFKKTTNAGRDIFTFISLNKSNLKKPSTYTASSISPSQILLNIFTAIGQAASSDARLQYYEEDAPSGSHSPTIINTPNIEIIRRMAYHGNKYAIIKPNGVFLLDSNRVPSNGPYTINSSSGEIRGDPIIETIDSQLNKVTVYGAFDPDTGVLFNGKSEDTTAQDDGTGVNEYSKRYPDLRSNTDCTNRAIAIRTGTGFNPQIITVPLINVYGNPGEIINFAYSPKSFSASNVYIKKGTLNLMTGVCRYELSTGIFEDWGLSQEQWSLATEGEGQIGSGIYATDINTIYLELWKRVGATENPGGGVLLDALSEEVLVFWYTPSNIDDSRAIDIYIQFQRGDSNADTISIEKDLRGWICDGGADNIVQWNYEGDTLPACASLREQVKKLTLTAANNYSNYKYQFILRINEASRDIVLQSITIVYYIKRTL